MPRSTLGSELADINDETKTRRGAPEIGGPGSLVDLLEETLP